MGQSYRARAGALRVPQETATGGGTIAEGAMKFKTKKEARAFVEIYNDARWALERWSITYERKARTINDPVAIHLQKTFYRLSQKWSDELMSELEKLSFEFDNDKP